MHACRSNTINRLKTELCSADSPASAQALMARLNELSKPGASEYSQFLKGQGFSKFLNVLGQCAVMVAEAEKKLADYKLKAKTDEAAFLAAHGLPYEPTAVSRQYDLALAEAKQHLAGCSENNRVSHLPHAGSFPALNWISALG